MVLRLPELEVDGGFVVVPVAEVEGQGVLVVDVAELGVFDGAVVPDEVFPVDQGEAFLRLFQREGAVVGGQVGAGGFGAPLIFAMNSYRWNEAGALLAGLIVLILIIEFISTRIRVKLTRG